ncbi:hypothetical protein ABG768_015768 [Culter alburnus]|uniref:Uncharacterized protein n=1 Tax=Culter alburnus TaxID=194366 RepID=A0AAW1Z3B3_CULAL
MRAKRSLDSAVGYQLMTSSPLVRGSSWKDGLGQRSSGDSLPTTIRRECCPERFP